jgi:hypothetical protein
MTDEQKAELDSLKAKLRAREGRPGWAANCEEIRKRIAEIENGD